MAHSKFTADESDRYVDCDDRHANRYVDCDDRHANRYVDLHDRHVNRYANLHDWYGTPKYYSSEKSLLITAINTGDHAYVKKYLFGVPSEMYRSENIIAFIKRFSIELMDIFLSADKNYMKNSEVLKYAIAYGRYSTLQQMEARGLDLSKCTMQHISDALLLSEQVSVIQSIDYIIEKAGLDKLAVAAVLVQALTTRWHSFVINDTIGEKLIELDPGMTSITAENVIIFIKSNMKKLIQKIIQIRREIIPLDACNQALRNKKFELFVLFAENDFPVKDITDVEFENVVLYGGLEIVLLLTDKGFVLPWISPELFAKIPQFNNFDMVCYLSDSNSTNYPHMSNETGVDKYTSNKYTRDNGHVDRPTQQSKIYDDGDYDLFGQDTDKVDPAELDSAGSNSAGSNSVESNTTGSTIGQNNDLTNKNVAANYSDSDDGQSSSSIYEDWENVSTDVTPAVETPVVETPVVETPAAPVASVVAPAAPAVETPVAPTAIPVVHTAFKSTNPSAEFQKIASSSKYIDDLMRVYSRILKLINGAIDSNSNIIIGVVGEAGSGKSFCIDFIKKRIPIEMLTVDFCTDEPLSTVQGFISSDESQAIAYIDDFDLIAKFSSFGYDKDVIKTFKNLPIETNSRASIVLFTTSQRKFITQCGIDNVDFTFELPSIKTYADFIVYVENKFAQFKVAHKIDEFIKYSEGVFYNYKKFCSAKKLDTILYMYYTENMQLYVDCIRSMMEL